MAEERFWALIDELGGVADDRGRHRLWLALRRLEDGNEVLAFHDRFSEVLHRLDLRSIATQRWRASDQPWWLPRVPGISADGFLYARCAAVAEGRTTVEAILAEHSAFRRRWELAEELLTVAPEAYEATTKRPFPWDRDAPYSYETGSNELGGWRRRALPPGNPQ
ncbi:DUF4240 domain-containing protein [Cellulomonas humilata]|nr:DUF4240 domain-containing protein [Cellulomonas humilata]